jgi:hypothetical protein
MYKSKEFGKSIATWGMIAGVLMIIPLTAGAIGLVFSFITLLFPVISIFSLEYV